MHFLVWEISSQKDKHLALLVWALSSFRVKIERSHSSKNSLTNLVSFDVRHPKNDQISRLYLEGRSQSLTTCIAFAVKRATTTDSVGKFSLKLKVTSEMMDLHSPRTWNTFQAHGSSQDPPDNAIILAWSTVLCTYVVKATRFHASHFNF